MLVVLRVKRKFPLILQGEFFIIDKCYKKQVLIRSIRVIRTLSGQADVVPFSFSLFLSIQSFSLGAENACITPTKKIVATLAERKI